MSKFQTLSKKEIEEELLCAFTSGFVAAMQTVTTDKLPKGLAERIIDLYFIIFMNKHDFLMDEMRKAKLTGGSTNN